MLVGDAEDLTLIGNLPHAITDGMGSFAADIGVDFVEDQNGNGSSAASTVLSASITRASSPEEQWRARAGGFAGVGRGVKLHGVQPGGLGLVGAIGGIERDIELALGKAEVVEMRGNDLGQLGDEFLPLGGKFAGRCRLRLVSSEFARRPAAPIRHRGSLVQASFCAASRQRNLPPRCRRTCA